MGAQHDTAREHRKEILALWRDGIAIRTIAERHGVAQGVISALLEEEGVRSNRPHHKAEERTRRRAALLEWVRANPGATVAEAAEANGLTYPLAANYLRGTEEHRSIVNARALGVRVKPGLGRQRVYTDEQMLEHLLRVWNSLSEQTRATGLGPALYRALAGEGSPSSALYDRRFGSWRAACEAAGIQAAPSNRSHYTRVENQALLEAVAAYLRTGDSTYRGYMEWAQRTGNPSGSTIRNRLGRWPDVLQQTLARNAA